VKNINMASPTHKLNPEYVGMIRQRLTAAVGPMGEEGHP